MVLESIELYRFKGEVQTKSEICDGNIYYLRRVIIEDCSLLSPIWPNTSRMKKSEKKLQFKVFLKVTAVVNDIFPPLFCLSYL